MLAVMAYVLHVDKPGYGLWSVIYHLLCQLRSHFCPVLWNDGLRFGKIRENKETCGESIGSHLLYVYK